MICNNPLVYCQILYNIIIRSVQYNLALVTKGITPHLKFSSHFELPILKKWFGIPWSCLDITTTISFHIVIWFHSQYFHLYIIDFPQSIFLWFITPNSNDFLIGNSYWLYIYIYVSIYIPIGLEVIYICMTSKLGEVGGYTAEHDKYNWNCTLCSCTILKNIWSFQLVIATFVPKMYTWINCLSIIYKTQQKCASWQHDW